MARIFVASKHKFSAIAVLTAFLLVLAGGAQADPLSSACRKTYSPQTLDVTQPINLGQLKLQLYFYACSGAYDSDVAKVLADAQTYVAKRAGEVTNPALVLDIDETSLSNLPQMLADDFGYIPNSPCDDLPDGPCGFNDWMMKPHAKALKGLSPSLMRQRLAALRCFSSPVASSCRPTTTTSFIRQR